MDTVHQLDNKPWISKRNICIREQLQFRAEQFRDNNVDISAATENEQQDETSYELELGRELAQFASKNQKEVKDCFMFNTTDVKSLTTNPRCPLKTFQSQLDHAKKMISDQAYKVNYLLQLKTTRKELLMRHLAQLNRQTNSQPADQSELAPDNALRAIVVVQVWCQPAKKMKVKLAREILFRSDQCLTELRDQIKCERDYGVPMELSDNPEQFEKVFRGELFKSAFFLVRDTFYNDLRDANNIDLSTDIIKWASQKVNTIGREGENSMVSRGIGPFKSAKMEECTFEDLRFKLGCPYLYLHQGDCEHLFTISDIRYVTESTIRQNKMKFPYLTAISAGSRTEHLRCYMCKNRPPHWYTRHNSRLPLDPYFFCEECFYLFNYTSDKKKIGTFQAYLYSGTYGVPNGPNI